MALHPRATLQSFRALQWCESNGATRGDQVAVLSGVKEGDIVVSAGQIKLRSGATVVVNNTVQPTADANPAPPNE